MVSGNFGIGKTGICYRPMEQVNKVEWRYKEFDNLYNLGGDQGYDRLSSYRLAQVVEIMKTDRNYLVHGVYFVRARYERETPRAARVASFRAIAERMGEPLIVAGAGTTLAFVL